MGTRSITIIKEESGAEITRIYRQYDGAPHSHGAELAALCNVNIVNGFSTTDGVANGMECLAAQIIRGLKQGTIDSGSRGPQGVGGVYVTRPGVPHYSGAEYVYTVTPGKEAGTPPMIACARPARGGDGTDESPDRLASPFKKATNATAFLRWAKNWKGS